MLKLWRSWKGWKQTHVFAQVLASLNSRFSQEILQRWGSSFHVSIPSWCKLLRVRCLKLHCGLSGAEGSDLKLTRGALKDRSLSARGTSLKARADEVNSDIKREQLGETGGFPKPWISSTEVLGTEASVYTDTIWEQMHYMRTLKSVVMNWRNMSVIAGDPDLFTANVCWPQALWPNAEPDFALNWYDRHYDGQGALYVQQYKFVPAPAVTQGIPIPTRKRSVEVLVYPDATVAYVVDAGNSTRPAIPEEIAEGLGIDACLDIHCTQEKEKLRNDVVGHRKRQVYLNEHKDEVSSILAAGMPLQDLKSFETGSSEMVLTDSPVAPPVPTETHSGAIMHSPVVTVTVTEMAPPIIEGRAHGHMKAHMRKREHAKYHGVQ
jgi:hypothetical protein